MQFFTEQKRMVTLLDVKPKLNTQDEKRVRLDLAMALTADALSGAPENVKEAFYAVTKDSLGLNIVGITTEFKDVKATFYSTPQTKTPSLEIAGCTLRQLEVSRPGNKIELVDGDVSLGFHINVPANREVWRWCYDSFGSTLCMVVEEVQPFLPHIKAANSNGDGQGILDMEKQQAQSTIATSDSKAEFSDVTNMPHQGKVQKRAVAKVKTAKKQKK